MKARRLIVSAMVVTMAVAAAGCGSSSSGGSGVAGTSKGVITALGSIFVNGVEYATTSSSVTVDKSSGTESELKVGRVVTVKGSQSDDLHGIATTVEYKDNLEGPVDVTPTAGATQFQAFGQTISVNTTAATVAAGKTVFQGFTALTDLAAGSVVEVSGMPDANGIIQASYIEKKSSTLATSSIELKGAISTLNTTAKTFKINGLTVDYSVASLNDLSSGIANGLYVEVSGSGGNYTLGASPTFKATKVENDKEDANGTEGAKLSVEGFVTGFTQGNNTFKVNGQTVNTGTLSLSGIDMTKKIEVEGVLSSGVLMASRIKMSS
ncbi:hypothetical protein KI809_14895 [Geobacter pelophilus]|uniref:DUF5666 domain-containing protein n=1 Tax=Geoanaerobacter pelophilus TaxID=60036 RepID=A0AAW4L4C0_9BACT|nr:DUF5666 domain-containing protein [Geoanaerobacter pelophilus]MBT0665594.1 hypothetical protein [Geoanaerobacter pelophilus]